MKQSTAREVHVAHATRGLSDFRLKIIGAILIAVGLLSGLAIPNNADIASLAQDDMASLTIAIIGEAISWVAIPIYAWLVVEGYTHTRNVWLYALRLLALAVICEIPYDLATSGIPVDWTSQNPVFALAASVVVLGLIDSCRILPSQAARILLSVAAVVCGTLWMLTGCVGVRQQLMNAGVLVLALTVLFRMLANRENTMMLTSALLCTCFFILPTFGIAILHFRNSEIGYSRPWAKWALYAVYPIMLLAFALRPYMS